MYKRSTLAQLLTPASAHTKSEHAYCHEFANFYTMQGVRIQV